MSLKKGTSKMLYELEQARKNDIFIETSIGVESAIITLFQERNVPDQLFEAYELSFSDISKDQSLFEKFHEIQEQGDGAIQGFVSNIKGKLAELQIAENLEGQLPGYNFELAADPTNEVWDIVGNNLSGGEDMLVQVKMNSGENFSDVIEGMLNNPDVHYEVSTELFDKISHNSPELIEQLIDSGISTEALELSTQDDLEVLVENQGIDIPDSVKDVLPFVSEIVLTIRLINRYY